jgi:hypothetical protein
LVPAPRSTVVPPAAITSVSSKPQQEQVIRGLPPRGGRERLRNGDSGPARRRDETGPEDSWLVVVVIQVNPGNRPGFRGSPQRQVHRLARAGRAGDNGQRAPPRTLGNQLGDPRALHRPVRHTRRRDPRCQDRKVSRNCRPPGGDRHLLGETCTWSQPERSGALESTHSYLSTGVTLDPGARRLRQPFGCRIRLRGAECGYGWRSFARLVDHDSVLSYVLV